MYKPTPPFVLAGCVLIGLALLLAWFMWAISQAHADTIEPRAISAADHRRCADMPRGNQQMEMERQECFNELYQRPFRIEYGR